MQARDSRQAFVGYEEGPILFRPTYRYDLGTDNYDTSEKMRIPAWTGMPSPWFQHPCCAHQPLETTDRILYKGNQLDLAVYSRAGLKGSDHKPGRLNCPSMVIIADHSLSLRHLQSRSSHHRLCEKGRLVPAIVRKCSLYPAGRKT